MKRGYLLPITLLLVILLTLGTSGCNSGDIWSSLNEAQDYIAVVGIKMEQRGWTFPKSPVSWVEYVRDLKDSIKEAKGLGIETTGAVRDIERAIIKADMPQLNEAFNSNPDW